METIMKTVLVTGAGGFLGSPDSLKKALPDFEWTPIGQAIEETIRYYQTL